MVDVTEDPTLPADDTTTEESTNDNSGGYTPGEDSAYCPDKLDLDDIEPDTYPEDLVEAGARWPLWQDSDGRKVPRNPQWGRSDRDGGYAFVGAKNPDAWLEFESARDWIDHDDDLGLTYYLTSPDRTDWDDDPNYQSVDLERDVPEELHVGLLDFDDIRDSETGEVAPDAAALLDQFAGTFCEWSPSSTGAHPLGGFRLPDGVQTLTIDLSSPEWPDAELELYPGRRYTTIAGDHIPGSASSTRNIEGIVDDLLANFPGALEAAQASTPASRPDEFDPVPSTSKEAFAEIETTDDMQDVSDAIQHTGPSNIRLRSRVTHERSDGTKDLDPSWAQSKSGTRLAEVDEVVTCADIDGSSKEELVNGHPDRSLPARSLYTGDEHGHVTEAVDHFEAIADVDWRIISAGFGLVRPDTGLPAYECTFQNTDSVHRRIERMGYDPDSLTQQEQVQQVAREL